MGRWYDANPATPRFMISMNIGAEAQARDDLGRLAYTLAAVRAEVPPAEVPIPPVLPFPQLSPEPTAPALTAALSELSRDQLDYVAVLMGKHGIGNLTGEGPVPETAFRAVRELASPAQLAELAEAVKGAPAELARAARPAPGARPRAVIPALQQLEPDALRAVARKAGVDLEDMGGTSRLGFVVELARSAASRNRLDDVIAAL